MNESPERDIDPPEPKPPEPDWDSIRKAREIDDEDDLAKQITDHLVEHLRKNGL